MLSPALLVLIGLPILFLIKKGYKWSAKEKQPKIIDTLNFEQICSEVKRKSYYYHQLNDPEKQLFLKRVWVFFHDKKFESRGSIEVSFHMKAVIATYAAQVTFGFDDVRLRHFKTIIVYPRPYLSSITKQLHKGETHKSGAIVFSWSDLKQGHDNPRDGVNLALHEFAHAMRLEDRIPNEEYRFLDPRSIQAFERLATSERFKADITPHPLLREYAFSNNEEFFAVCVENFFERTSLLKEHCPEIYGLLKIVLKQDPLSSPTRING